MRSRSLFAAALVLAFASCTEKAAVIDAGPPPAKPKHLTVLVTGHETGDLPEVAPRLVAKWDKEEHWPDVIALSTGDTFSGLALSTHFAGKSTAEAMKALQYRAAALGNHELDLGIDTFLSFRDASGITFLGANVKDKPNADKPLKLPAFVVIERSGVKVGVVGLTSEKTVKATLAGRAAGLEVVAPETVVEQAMADARAGGAKVVVVLVDDCFSGLQKAFEAHPTWKADLVVGSRCEAESQEAKVGSTPFFSAGDDVTFYVAAAFEVFEDGHVVSKASRKDVPKTGKADADMTKIYERWKAQLDEQLGEKLGFSKKGIKEDAPQLRTWVATALMEQTKAEVGLLNKKGVRSELKPGDITQATVYTMLPFENSVLTVKLTGEALNELKANPEAIIVGGTGKFDPKKTYTVATTDFIYFGGDGLGLEKYDADPQPTGAMWQTPVIEWTRAKKSTEKQPLEKLLK